MVNDLIKLYKKNRYTARVIFMNNSYRNYSINRVTVFEKANGEFNIILIKKSYGISKTNVMYNHDKRLVNISYKNGKFYLIVNGSIKTLTIRALSNCNHMNILSIIKPYLISKFGWLRYIFEHHVLDAVALNTIVSKKLYSLKKALRHQYKVPYPVAKILHKNRNSQFVRHLKNYLDYLDNIESFKEEWLVNHIGLLEDTLKMGKTLNKKVNCSWSSRRLREVHDEWSKEITSIIFIDGDREMSISDIFIKFADFSGYKLLRTTKEMAHEGMKNNHCVASYVSSVENGNCAIYSISGYTLELRKTFTIGTTLTIKQFRGYENINAPEELFDKVSVIVSNFNEAHPNKEGIPINKGRSFEEIFEGEDLLPF
jgi:hypothetical protein